MSAFFDPLVYNKRSLHKKSSIVKQDLGAIPNATVKNVAKHKLDSYSADKWELDQGDAFYICDLGNVYRQYLQWMRCLPRIKPYFAIKANPDPMIARLLDSLGVGFDCASKGEIQLVLKLGVNPNQIIYANPCKQASYIQYAAQNKVYKMTFDNADELVKVKSLFPDAQLLIRLLPDDAEIHGLGKKYGATMASAYKLLCLAKELSLNVIGVSFHVGLACMEANAFTTALCRARTLFDYAKSIGLNFTLLDVGGGFPGREADFESITSTFGPVVDKYFSPDINVISEPGAYFVDSASTLCTQVIGRRLVETDNGEPSYMYYVNDGIFGSFFASIFNVKNPIPQVLMKNKRYLYGEELEEPTFECSVWGPTCAHDDCIKESIRLPLLREGDWLYWTGMGAYTLTGFSEFNGFKKKKVIYTNSFT
ncbi:pyridoxal-dependent decarboxylase [Chlamydoabsidia padenii]|nr:pyridoxal-dependent decarboxylase [Chlamydoabsidia padenii]